MISEVNSVLSTSNKSGSQPAPVPHKNLVPEPPTKSVLLNSNLHINGYEYRFERIDENLYSVTQQRHPAEVQLLPRFGKKLLPIFDPEWTEITQIKATSVAEAASKFIQAGIQSSDTSLKHLAPQPKVTQVANVSNSIDDAKPLNLFSRQEKPKESVEGLLIWSGVRNFPDANKPGKTYENFCIEVETNTGLRVLQGEGLQDALAEVNAKSGTRISVKRLGKVPVELINKKTKQPLVDEAGKPKLGYKWQWKIQPIS